VKQLTLQNIISLFPSVPFAFDPTFHKPDHFTSGYNYWEEGIKWQTWNWKGISLGLKFINCATVDNPKILIEIYSQDKLDSVFLNSLINEISYRYNLKLDLSEFYSEFKND